MNGDQNQRKDSAIKTLAIIGFTATIVLGVWLAVQVVQLAPSAFTSLASLADSVYGKPDNDELTVVTSKSVVNNAEVFALMWSEADDAGTYNFTYSCTEGVAVLIENSEGAMVPAACDQPFPLSGEGRTNVQVQSENQRFIDVAYSVTFTKEGENEVAFADTDNFTIVNASIPQSGLVAGVQDEETEPTPEEDSVSEDTSTAVETIPEENPSPTTPVEQPTYEFTYQLPVSDPNGFTDLEVTYLGVGHLDTNNNFIPRSEIDNDARGALRFAVKNIGTKTSDRWTYEVEMPNGATYESPRQDGLKPNETATIILGFSVTDTGVQSFGGEVTVDDDRTTANNEFAWSVTVTN